MIFIEQRLERHLDETIPAALEQIPLQLNNVPPTCVGDVEDISEIRTSPNLPKRVSINKKKRKRSEPLDNNFADTNASTWREALGPPPSCDDFHVCD